MRVFFSTLKSAFVASWPSRAMTSLSAFLALGLGNGCSRYGRRITDAEPMRPVIVLVPSDFETGKQRVIDYVRTRHRLEGVFTPTGASGEIRCNQRWVRDT